MVEDDRDMEDDRPCPLPENERRAEALSIEDLKLFEKERRSVLCFGIERLSNILEVRGAGPD